MKYIFYNFLTRSDRCCFNKPSSAPIMHPAFLWNLALNTKYNISYFAGFHIPSEEKLWIEEISSMHLAQKGRLHDRNWASVWKVVSQTTDANYPFE